VDRHAALLARHTMALAQVAVRIRVRGRADRANVQKDYSMSFIDNVGCALGPGDAALVGWDLAYS